MRASQWRRWFFFELVVAVDELEEVELLRHGGGGGLGRDATTDAVVVLRHTEGVVIALAGLATLRPQAVRNAAS